MAEVSNAQPHRTPNDVQVSEFGRPIEGGIRTVEQQAIDLEVAHYEALREARDASRRAVELRLQALETRMRLCVLVECEPLSVRQPTATVARKAVLQLMHIYFDEPGKYRLVLQPLGAQASRESNDERIPVWCSKVIYDGARPEGKCGATISVAVRAAYRVAE